MSWGRWAGLVQRFRQALPPPGGSPTGLAMRATAESFALLAATGSAGLDVSLIDGSRGGEADLLLGADRGLGSILRAGPTAGEGDAAVIEVIQPPGVGSSAAGAAGPDRDVEGVVTIFTSGTTGVPKPVRHSWQSLLRPARPSVGQADPGPRRWLWTFRPDLYAGLQVFAQCLVDRAALVVPPARRLGARRGASDARGGRHSRLLDAVVLEMAAGDGGAARIRGRGAGADHARR